MRDEMIALFYLGLVLGAVILASFVLWFRFRDRPAWDSGLFGVAAVATALLVGARYLEREAGCLLTVPLIPSLILFFWFAGLWSVRRERAAIYRWGIRHGYHITSLDRTYDLGGPGQRLRSEYRIVARRVSDGQIRVGSVFPGVSSPSGDGFVVHWEGEIKPHSLHRPAPPGPNPS